ncbi:MAG: glycosyltransferase family 4 protein [Desulfuromonadales bacterium]|nr:glycosyltransferase family 4 protein [Desulfuromonadales bacterium]
MRVLFQSRTTLFSVPGGDTVQILKTKEFLERLGANVAISTELEPDLADYDLVHLFNLIRPQEVLAQARNARRQGRKITLSTIYGLYTEYDRKARGGIGGLLSRSLSTGQTEYLKTLARAGKNREFHRGTLQYLRCGHLGAQREIVSLVDVFLPNSEGEKGRVLTDFPGAAGKPFVIVPNAVDTHLFDSEATEIAPELEPYRGCVLCVARIEGRKNQLNLVRAMQGLPWSLVLAGKPAPNHLDYYEQIRREAGPNVHFHGQLDHALLPALYKVARVHVLVSWMETPGLSSLEAAAMGCALVVTDRGDTREYFEDYASYCEPDSVESIRAAILKAYERPADPRLRQRVRQEFNWQKTAEKTLEAYRLALGMI